MTTAALDLIGRTGLESFSMPKLAAELRVSSPSLYHYFADRDALLAAVARVVATPEPPDALPPGADWTDYLVANAIALRRTILAHPHCAPLLVRFMPRANMFDEYEQQCLFLAHCGVPAHLHVKIVDGLTALTIGAAILHENAADYADSGRGPHPGDDFPALRAALDVVDGHSGEEMFETYVRTYLAGVVQAIAS